MALYFFHLCDGSDEILDTEGREIADDSLIPPAALKEARAIISHEALTGKIRLNQRIEVRDNDGAAVHRLQFKEAVTIS